MSPLSFNLDWMEMDGDVIVTAVNWVGFMYAISGAWQTFLLFEDCMSDGVVPNFFFQMLHSIARPLLQM